MKNLYVIFNAYYGKTEADKRIEEANKFFEDYPGKYTISYSGDCNFITVVLEEYISSITLTRLQKILKSEYYEILTNKEDLIKLYQGKMG